MKQFVLVYLGGNQPTNPDEASKHFERYMDWMKSLGPAIVVPTIPLKDTITVRPTGEVKEGGASAMSGFTIIKAESLEDALTISKACPFLEIGGSLEVSELMEMPLQ